MSTKCQYQAEISNLEFFVFEIDIFFEIINDAISIIRPMVTWDPCVPVIEKKLFP